MPTVDVEENIKKLEMNIEQMTQEIFPSPGYAPDFPWFPEGWSQDHRPSQ
jgi:hypothetical protein